MDFLFMKITLEQSGMSTMHKNTGKSHRKKQVQRKTVHLMTSLPPYIGINTMQIPLYLHFVKHLYVEVGGEDMKADDFKN